MFVQDTKAKLNFNEHFQLDSAIAVFIQESICPAYKECSALLLKYWSNNSGILWGKEINLKNPENMNYSLTALTF